MEVLIKLTNPNSSKAKVQLVAIPYAPDTILDEFDTPHKFF